MYYLIQSTPETQESLIYGALKSNQLFAPNYLDLSKRLLND